jgi:hypothetical protein
MTLWERVMMGRQAVDQSQLFYLLKPAPALMEAKPA